jgi:DNA (cytosine-5)-methyltransferase 1
VDITKKLPTVISFCSGYGGIERGLDLAGVEHRVIAYVEIEAFAIANLVNKMEDGVIPPAPIYTDLKTFPAELFRGRVDLLTGGYPCQPFSGAGSRKGEDDPRHLWPFIRRHLQSIRPARCFFENVEGHISLGLSSVISDLEEDGYRSTWGIFSAREVGAPHQRKRVFIMGNSKYYGSPYSEKRRYINPPGDNCTQGASQALKPERASRPSGDTGLSIGVADSGGKGLQGSSSSRNTSSKEEEPNDKLATRRSSTQGGAWPPEPRLGRVVDGCANRVDRIRLLGNGVVPQTAAKAWIKLEERYKNEQG